MGVQLNLTEILCCEQFLHAGHLREDDLPLRDDEVDVFGGSLHPGRGEHEAVVALPAHPVLRLLGLPDLREVHLQHHLQIVEPPLLLVELVPVLVVCRFELLGFSLQALVQPLYLVLQPVVAVLEHLELLLQVDRLRLPMVLGDAVARLGFLLLEAQLELRLLEFLLQFVYDQDIAAVRVLFLLQLEPHTLQLLGLKQHLFLHSLKPLPASLEGCHSVPVLL